MLQVLVYTYLSSLLPLFVVWLISFNCQYYATVSAEDFVSATLRSPKIRIGFTITNESGGRNVKRIFENIAVQSVLGTGCQSGKDQWNHETQQKHERREAAGNTQPFGFSCVSWFQRSFSG